MDFVFDLNHKNWPALKTFIAAGNQLIISLADNGYHKLITQQGGIGKAVIADKWYTIQLPGQIVDVASKIVSFKIVDC